MASTGQVYTMNKMGQLKVTDSLGALLLKLPVKKYIVWFQQDKTRL